MCAAAAPMLTITTPRWWGFHDKHACLRTNLPTCLPCWACGEVNTPLRVQVVGCIVAHEGRVLLCRRAIEPCRGLWTVPAGGHSSSPVLNRAQELA